jgi:hypothetical protein
MPHCNGILFAELTGRKSKKEISQIKLSGRHRKKMFCERKGATVEQKNLLCTIFEAISATEREKISRNLNPQQCKPKNALARDINAILRDLFLG